MTITETDMTDKARHRYLTTGEVLEATGLSFRVLDYWLRTGAIKLADGTTPGSGVSRRYSLDEVEAIKRLVERYNDATSEIKAIRSGRAWVDELSTGQ